MFSVTIRGRLLLYLPIIVLSALASARYKIFKLVTNQTIYLVDRGITARVIPHLDTLTSLGYKFDDLDIVDDSFLNRFQLGPHVPLPIRDIAGCWTLSDTHKKITK